eukprot:TRINITY_DN2787_c0_g1_i1.p1 TRINITY_DN2787_c0_g1~~TRINITY_DN2787_c0_g1_i1.p1  ORF type:complete len:201 (+),score=33.74 TRINITY_DN2787_c0_g1_i1:146-748(+)
MNQSDVGAADASLAVMIIVVPILMCCVAMCVVACYGAGSKTDLGKGLKIGLFSWHIFPVPILLASTLWTALDLRIGAGSVVAGEDVLLVINIVHLIIFVIYSVVGMVALGSESAQAAIGALILSCIHLAAALAHAISSLIWLFKILDLVDADDFQVDKRNGALAGLFTQPVFCSLFVFLSAGAIFLGFKYYKQVAETKTY